jgi:hypothetical protein
MATDVSTFAPRSIHRRRLRSWALVVIAIVTLGSVLVVLDWTAINHVNVEAGDFAANSLQVQDAKHLHLLAGHYSRFGFHHPGPALLYVLALGEWLFYDLSGLVPSGFSGQLVAIAFFDAFWIVLIYRLVRSWSRDWRLPLLSTITFLLTVTLLDHQFINGIWFPLVYPLPFATFLLALASVCSGRPRAALYLALSAGVLVNGHASFLTILPTIVVLMLAFTWLAFRGEPDHRVISRAFVRSHARILWASLAIFGLFMLPLMITTVRNFPGPIVDYLRFGGGHGANSAADALAFTAGFWGGAAPLVVAILVMVILVMVDTGSPTLTRIVRGVVLACAAGTVAVFVYAVFGVDSVDNTYLGYFAYTIPGLLALAIVTAAWPRLDARLGPTAAAAIAVALGFVTLVQHVPTSFPPDYDRPEITALQQELASKAVDGRVVLDLDNTVNWMTVWSTVAGVEVLNRRRNESLLCINENWSIAFTEAARCTPADLAGSVRYRVAAAPSLRDPADPSLAGVTLTREPLP